MIEFTNVTKTYAGGDALQAVNMKVESGELFVLVGPSGSGKTTLLKMVNCLNAPSTGTVAIDGVNVSSVNVRKLRQEIGYVLQAGALFPNMTVGENAAVQLLAQGWPEAKRRERVRSLLDQVGLDPETFMDRMPSELSGGEAQRVGIVRALAVSPKMVLMDEPFSALDPLSRRQLQDLVLRLHHQLDTTIIFVTHDMGEALRLADRLAVIHEGVLLQVGTPTEILAEPANDFVASFFADDARQRHFLTQVVAAGFGQPAQGDEVVLPAAATIYDWAARLREQPDLIVASGGTALRPADLIGFMATLNGEAGQ